MTTETVTNSLKQQIQEAIKGESSEPQYTILHVLKVFDGKKLTVRIADKINKALDRGCANGVYEGGRVCIDKSYNMTRLEWGLHGNSKSLLISYEVKNVVIDAEWVEAQNPAYFSARVKRNNKREKITEQDIELLAITAKSFAATKQALEDVLECEVFVPDNLALQKIVGLD